MIDAGFDGLHGFGRTFVRIVRELPGSLQGVVEAVLGLDSRPQAAAHFRIRPASSAATSFTPPQVAALYGFPAGSRMQARDILRRKLMRKMTARREQRAAQNGSWVRRAP